MKFSIFERIMLMGLLPDKANYRTMLAVQELRNQLLFPEEEVADSKIVVRDGQYYWDSSKDRMKDIVIGPVATEIVEQQLQKINEEGNPHLDLVFIYDKFGMPLSNKSQEKLKKDLIDMDSNGRLPLAYISRYERFVVESQTGSVEEPTSEAPASEKIQ